MIQKNTMHMMGKRRTSYYDEIIDGIAKWVGHDDIAARINDE